MPDDALRNWRAAGKWQQAVRLADGQERSDLEWIVELDTLVRRRPAGQRKRLTAGERECLVQLLDSVERLPRSGRTAAVASALPLVILPALGPGLPPGFLEVDGMPPVPDKARTGRFFGRRVMEFQNWTLASNARWRLTDEQLALLWQAEFPNSRTRYTRKSVRTRAQPLQPGEAQQRPAPDADPPVRSRWESGAGHAVLLTHGWPRLTGMIVQSSPTQSTRRLRMELNTTTPFFPLPPRRTGLHGRRRESAPNPTPQGWTPFAKKTNHQQTRWFFEFRVQTCAPLSRNSLPEAGTAGSTRASARTER